jgi:hypothetical protein
MNTPNEKPTHENLPTWDMVEDITVSEANKFHLAILPYFFDEETAKRLHTEYIYLGLRE